MHLNLNDPDSIVAWWCEFPERHWDYLDVFARRPEFLMAVRQARHRIRTDPQLSPILAKSLAAAAQHPHTPPARRVDDAESLDEDIAPGDYGSH
jgi:hypothetical protein